MKLTAFQRAAMMLVMLMAPLEPVQVLDCLGRVRTVLLSSLLANALLEARVYSI